MAVVALIDHDAVEARLVYDSVLLNGHHVVWADDAWEALLMINRVRPDIIILNYALPEARDLLMLVRSVRGQTMTQVILISASAPEPYDMHKFDIRSCLTTPLDVSMLQSHLEQPHRSHGKAAMLHNMS